MIEQPTQPEPPVAPRPVPAPTPPVRPLRPVHKREREGLKSILSTIAILLIAPVIAIFLTAFVFQSYQVDGPSMQTTLFNNDRLVVWKLPKTWSRITGHPYVPNRGDVVVFTQPRLVEFGQDPTKQLIKRVIGLPGERVVVQNHVVTVYNAKHPNGFQPDATMPYGSVIKDTPTDVDTTVPSNSVFVLGDNRGNSLDSRFFGPVQTKYIIGKLIMRVLPVNELKRF